MVDEEDAFRLLLLRSLRTSARDVQQILFGLDVPPLVSEIGSYSHTNALKGKEVWRDNPFCAIGLLLPILLRNDKSTANELREHFVQMEGS